MLDVGADGNLLFGLLALQNGFIDQAQLVAAFRAWSGDKGRPLADHLAAHGALDGDQVTAVGAIVADHLRAHGGAAERSLAAVAAGPSTVEGLTLVGDPALGDALAALTAVMPAVGGVGPSPLTPRAATAGPRYRVLRPHAKGGLGVVSVALDDELNREVALKEIHACYADDPVSRARFLLEAEVTGGLEHPGIVPVYGLGWYPDGRPYYAMRFVRGESLKEAVERFHADAALKRDPGRRAIARRKLLRRFLDVCEAVEYAHQRGVLHRDLKPGNVMVGKFGETLVVDWGLAKAVGRPDPVAAGDEHPLVPTTAGGSSGTLPGQTIGTPSYMSPEQAAGQIDRLGPASDVYSLGATLYCMMTGKPPFEGGDVNAVLHAVRKGVFPRPRALNPGVDRAAEAICLKAMALRPEDRYPSARALAEDVERYAADEPVRAWREPLARAAWRWARRHRTTVTTTAAVVLMTLAGLIAVLYLQNKENRELAEEKNALLESKRNANARFRVAMNAIRTFHTGVSKEMLLKDSEFGDLKTGLLRSARDFYAHLQALLRGDPDADSLQALAQAGFDLGTLMDQIGDKGDALNAHRNALAIRERLAREPGARPEARAEEARSRLAVAAILAELGGTSRALGEALRARSALAALAAAEPPRFRDDLARSHAAVADLLAQTGDAETALASYREATALLLDLAAARPDDVRLRSELALSRFHVGRMLWQTGRLDEAIRSVEEARAAQEALARDSFEIDFQGDLARSRFLIGFLMSQTGQTAAAIRLCKDALSAQVTLVNEYPAVTRLQSDMARSRYLMGTLLAQAGDDDEAMRQFERALALEEARVSANPDVPRFQADLASTCHEIAKLHMKAGRANDALPWLTRSRARREANARAHPDLIVFRRDLGRGDAEIGHLLTLAGNHVEASAAFERARARLEGLVAEYPASARLRTDLARCYELAGELAARAEPAAGSVPWFEKACAVRGALVRANPDVARFHGDHARGLTRVGDARRRAGHHGRAAAAYREAVAILEGLPDLTLTPDLLIELARGHAGLTGLAGRPGSGVPADEAEAHAVAAVLRLRRAADAGRLRSDDVRADPVFEPLAARPDFRLVLMDLAFPADPILR